MPGLLINCAKANYPSIEISMDREFIRVGEPFIIKMTYRWEKPLISSRTNEISQYCSHSAQLIVKKGEEEKSMQLAPYIEPRILQLQGTEGIEYSAYFVFFYDFYNGGLIFNEPGTYTIRMKGFTKFSNSLDVIVKPPTELQQKGLSLLSSDPCAPWDYILLTGAGTIQDYKEMPELSERITRIRKLADQCGETLLGKWAAAKLGIEEYEEVERQYDHLGERFVYMYRNGLIKEPLVEQSYNHLIKALVLPDEFLIREDALYNIIGIELIKGDYNKALSHAKELRQKYPKGKFGKRDSVANLQDEIGHIEASIEKYAQERREQVDNKVE
jgi:tetratricopeptide (TPR) repeat protein